MNQVSTGDLQARIEQWKHIEPVSELTRTTLSSYFRPNFPHTASISD